MLSGIPDGSLPDTLASIVKASYLEKLEVYSTIFHSNLYSRSICVWEKWLAFGGEIPEVEHNCGLGFCASLHPTLYI